MTSVSPRRAVPRAIAFLALVWAAVVASPLACGNLGEPSFEGQDASLQFDVGMPVIEPVDAAEEGVDAPTIQLKGTVLDPTGKPFGMALVAVEVGGLYRINPGSVGPDGGLLPSLKIDPFYRLGTMTDEAGLFSLRVPDETLGVHAYTNGFYCGVPDMGAIAASEAGVVHVLPKPLPGVDGGPTGQPIVTGFTIAPSVVGPGEVVTLTATVEAADPAHDPLSEQVLGIEPRTSWAGAFAPPKPGTPGVGYPNGVYGRLVTAPLEGGEYTFYVVAATEACVVSEPVSQTLIVEIDGGDD